MTCARRRLCRRSLGALLVLLGSLPAPSAAARDLLPLPDLELVEGVEPAVLEVFRAGRAAIDRLLADEAAGDRELAEAYGELGRAAVYFQLAELLEPCLRNAQALAPEDYLWPYYLGAFYQEERRLEEARAHLERAWELQPDDPTLAVRLGRLALLENRMEAARGYFERARESTDHAAAALYGLGRCAAESGDNDQAVEHFEAALRLQPEAAEIRQQLGLAYRKRGDLDAARRFLASEARGELSFPDPLIDGLKDEFGRSHVFAGLEAEKSGRWEEAVEEYRKAVEADPDNGVFRQALGQALKAVGDLDGAVTEHREAVRLLPQNGMAQVLLARVLGSRDGVTEEVLELYVSAVELSPDLKDTQLGLGRALLTRGRYEEASVRFARALELDPSDHTARLQWSRILLQLGEDQRALEEVEKILAAQPDSADALLTYGQALGRVERLELSKQVLEKAIELEDEAAARAVAHAALGDVLRAEGASAEALDHYRVAADLAPELAPIQLGLAEALGRAGLREEQLMAYETVLLLDPENFEARLARARVMAAEGRLSQAADELRSLLESDPGLLDVRLDLASILVRQGDLDDAAALLASALEEEKPGPRRAMLSLQMAGIRQLAGDDEGAVELYETVLVEAPELVDAHFNLAVSLARLDRGDQAVLHLRRAVEIDPTQAQTHLLLAQALAEQGRFVEARDALEQGLLGTSQSPILAGALAQLLVASPEPTIRDPARAVPLAERLHEAQPSLDSAALVAAALGAAGRFGEAAAWQARVVAEAQEAGIAEDRLRRMQQDLEAYRIRAGTEAEP